MYSPKMDVMITLRERHFVKNKQQVPLLVLLQVRPRNRSGHALIRPFDMQPNFLFNRTAGLPQTRHN